MPVWAFHPEGKSTYEIALSPQTPSAAVDNLGFAYDTIKSVAAKHGFHATMHPKAFSSGPKIGQHIHISIVNPRSGDGDHFGWAVTIVGTSEINHGVVAISFGEHPGSFPSVK